MVKKHVIVEGAIIHPTRLRRDDFVQLPDDVLHVVVGGVGIDNDAEVTASFVEVGFLEIAYLHRRVHQAVIVLGFERGPRERRRNAPSIRDFKRDHVLP